MIAVEKWDVLVVGAGPAGSCAAAASAAQGARTLLVDAKQRIGEQPHCGEFVPQRLFAEFDLSTDSVVQSVRYMETWIVDDGPGHQDVGVSGQNRPTNRDMAEASGPEPRPAPFRVLNSVTTNSPGFLIDRVRFDRDLARFAAGRGATVLCSTRLVTRPNGTWTLRCRGREIGIKARIVIAADGALSSVANILGLERPRLLRGTQVEAPLASPVDGTFVFLDRQIRGGYGWLFPKGGVANVGIGVTEGEGVHPDRILEQLRLRLIDNGMIRPGILARTGGVIPVSGLRDTLVHDNVMFCGDAAGLTHPITGAGIPQAVLSGTLAGRIAAQAARTGDLNGLLAYETQMRAHYGGVLGHGLAKRRLMMEHWDNPDFEATCEQTWIGFKGYGKRGSKTAGRHS